LEARSPGSVNGAATDVFQEGIRFPAHGGSRLSCSRSCWRTSASPFEIRGVLAAQSHLHEVGHQAPWRGRVTTTATSWSPQPSRRCSTTRRAEHEPASLNSATVCTTTRTTWRTAGVLQQEPVRICCTMTVAGETSQLRLFAGTSPQNPGVGNCTISDNPLRGVRVRRHVSCRRGGVSNSGASRAMDGSRRPRAARSTTRFSGAPTVPTPNVMFGAIHGCVIGCLSPRVMPGRLPAFHPGPRRTT